MSHKIIVQTQRIKERNITGRLTEMADASYTVSKATVFLLNRDPQEFIEVLNKYGIFYDFEPEGKKSG
jgi:hypothetical protein